MLKPAPSAGLLLKVVVASASVPILKKYQPPLKMTHLNVTGQALQTSVTERKPRKRMVALGAIALQLGISSTEIEEWCDRNALDIAEGCRGELEIDAATTEKFVRQYREYQYKKMAELDIAVLSQAQPITISGHAAAELKAQLEAQKSVEYEGLPNDPEGNAREEDSDVSPLNEIVIPDPSTALPPVEGGSEEYQGDTEGFILEGISKGKNYLDTLQKVVEAQPSENRKSCIKALKGKEPFLRERIVENVYKGKATESGLLKEAQKLKG